MEKPALRAETDDIAIVTFIRDPIEWILSLYNFVTLTPNHPEHPKRTGVTKYKTCPTAIVPKVIFKHHYQVLRHQNLRTYS
jgi:hypothetical protein